MADIRTLKLNLLADTSDFKNGLMGSQKATRTFAGRVGLYTRKAAEGFTLLASAAVTAATAIGIESVKAAIEDERSQRLLAKQMRNTIHATNAQVASMEDYISRVQAAYGIQDDKLRPALARLVRSTKDATEAQKWLNIAMNVSAATGKPLETVTAALGKAIDGNAVALGRLGLGIDKNVFKSQDLNLIYKTLASTFGGFADQEAKTLEGQMRRVSVSIDEMKEKLGYKLAPVIADEVIPQISRFIGVLTGTGDTPVGANMNGAIADAMHNKFYGTEAFAGSILNLRDSFSQFFAGLIGEGPDAQATLKNLADGMNALAKAINRVGDAFKFLNDQWDKLPSGLKTVAKALGTGPLGPLLNGLVGRATGGPVSANRAYLVGERGPELFVPNGNGSIMNANRTANMGGGGVTIVMNGIVDAESARRSIERLIQQSQRRTGPVNWNAAIS